MSKKPVMLLTSRPKLQLLSSKTASNLTPADMSQDERRRDERHLFREMFMGFLVREDGRNTEVELHDISNGGISFSTNRKYECLEKGEKATLNFFFKSSNVYFQCDFTILNVKSEGPEKHRHSGEATTDSSNRKALDFLVQFISTVLVDQIEDAA